MDEAFETDASLSNFSWLSDALQQLFLARKCMAYRCLGGRGSVHYVECMHCGRAHMAGPHAADRVSPLPV